MATTRKPRSERPCYACGQGTVRSTNLRGRTFEYRDEIALTFDADLEAPVCDRCGELYLTGALTDQFSAVLEQLRLTRKRQAAEHFVHAVETRFPDVPRALWEDTLGLSRGYLSRLTSGSRVADAALEILLEGFAKEPETALRLCSLSGHVPLALTEAVEQTKRATRRQSA